MYPLPRPRNLRAVCLFILLAASLLEAQAPTPISAAVREKVDAIVRQALTGTGVPSASIAIVQGGAITYLQAYGDGRIEPRTADHARRQNRAVSSEREIIGARETHRMKPVA